MSYAVFSSDGVYRYQLGRVWGDGPAVAFIGLNPSTADAENDDPTIRRCIGFAKAWGYNRLHMLNLFAFRATDPRELKRAADPVGRANDAAIVRVAGIADLVIAAWGVHGTYLARDEEVLKLLPRRPGVLGLTKDGIPKHPLYLPGGLQPIEWPEKPRVDRAPEAWFGG